MTRMLNPGVEPPATGMHGSRHQIRDAYCGARESMSFNLRSDVDLKLLDNNLRNAVI